ncbi:alkanesulfonate ABC transporter permease [Klebsiella pneumoniae]|nr:alkanesulfonate ABC transporter permease [Klebsiella pneumoniae]
MRRDWAFESWFRDALSDGAAWFMMKLQTPAGIKFYKCRFTDIYQGTGAGGPDLLEVHGDA